MNQTKMPPPLTAEELTRACIHEAGHFYVAYRFRPARVVSIRISQQEKTDPRTGKHYTCVGEAVTLDLPDSLPGVLVSIRAGGLAAESLVYDESYETLMQDLGVLRSIEGDLLNAKQDLIHERLLLPGSSPDEFLSMWKSRFYEARGFLRDSLDQVRRIAAYCEANQDRDIPAQEIISRCRLTR